MVVAEERERELPDVQAERGSSDSCREQIAVAEAILADPRIVRLVAVQAPEPRKANDVECSCRSRESHANRAKNLSSRGSSRSTRSSAPADPAGLEAPREFEDEFDAGDEKT